MSMNILAIMAGGMDGDVESGRIGEAVREAASEAAMERLLDGGMDVNALVNSGAKHSETEN